MGFLLGLLVVAVPAAGVRAPAGEPIASAAGDRIQAAAGERIGYPTAAGDGIALTVEIGRRLERAVGNATGWFCDDSSLVDASLVTREDINYWVITGVKEGATQCRVGTDPSRASFVFAVTVKRSSSKRRR